MRLPRPKTLFCRRDGMLSPSGDYQKPEWSGFPNSDVYALEVMKQGVLLEDIPLQGREYFLIGRQLDRVHIPAEHPSVSRVHAVINFSNNGDIMLGDLGSAQGTFVNKKMVDKNSFVRLQVGDLIKFAQSTRLYLLKGPDTELPAEYDSENLEQKRREAEERELSAKRAKDRQVERSGVSWGMSMDDEQQQEEEEEIERERREREQESNDKRNLMPQYLRRDENYDRKYGDRFTADIRKEDVLSKKDEETVEKIRKKERKIQNMQEENRRIYMKESSQDDGLTDGQQAAVQRNDKAIEQLSNEIDSMLSALRNKHSELQHNQQGTVESGANRKRARSITRDDDDSPLLDLTDQTADVSTNWRLKRKLERQGVLCGSSAAAADAITVSHRGALSFSELKALVDKASHRQRLLQEQLQVLTKNIQHSQLQLARNEIVDDVEQVIARDRIQEWQQQMRAMVVEEEQVQHNVKHFQRLLEVATPAIQSLAAAPSENIAGSGNSPRKSFSSPQKAPLESPNSARKTISEPMAATTVAAKAVTVDDHAAAGPVESQTPDTEATEDNYEQSRKVALNDFLRFVEEEKRRSVETSRATALPKPSVSDPTSSSAVGDQEHLLPVDKSALKKKMEDLAEFERKLRSAATGEDVTPTAARSFQPTQSSRTQGPGIRSAAVESPSRYSDAEPQHVQGAAESVLQGGEFVWVPPTRQTGDGRTSLNDKFGY